MDYTLVEFYDGSVNNVYELVFSTDMDEDDLGLVYFAYYCNDLDTYNGEGKPFNKKQIKHLYIEQVKYLADKEGVKIKDIYWLEWYLDRCSSDDLEDIPTEISEQVNQYEIISYYTWGLENLSDHRSRQIMDGMTVGILLKGKTDLEC